MNYETNNKSITEIKKNNFYCYANDQEVEKMNPVHFYEYSKEDTKKVKEKSLGELGTIPKIH